MILKSRQRKVG